MRAQIQNWAMARSIKDVGRSDIASKLLLACQENNGAPHARSAVMAP